MMIRLVGGLLGGVGRTREQKPRLQATLQVRVHTHIEKIAMNVSTAAV